MGTLLLVTALPTFPAYFLQVVVSGHYYKVSQIVDQLEKQTSNRTIRLYLQSHCKGKLFEFYVLFSVRLNMSRQ